MSQEAGSDATVVRSMFLESVDMPASGTRVQMIRGAAASLPLEDMGHLRLDEIVRGLTTMSGPAPEPSKYPSLIRNSLAQHMPTAWEEIARLTIVDLSAWPSVGHGKVVELIAFLASRINHPAETATGLAETLAEVHGLLDAMRTVAAWGAVAGHRDLLSALNEAAAGASDSPFEAVASILAIDLQELAGDRIIWWDRDVAVAELLAEFDERELEIFQARVLTGQHRPTRTLEELGESLGVTRERVRQLEARALDRLDGHLSNDRYRSLSRAAEEIRTKIGVANPIGAVDPVLADDPESIMDELLLWMAGPYHRSGGWVLHTRFATIANFIEDVFDEVAVDNVTTWEVLLDAATREGLPMRHFDAALSESTNVVDFEDHLVRWPNSTARRALTALIVRGVPMTTDELFEVEPRVTNIQSFRNALYASEDLVRVGLHRWGLREWGEDEYPGVVPAMVAVIEERGPQDVHRLGDELEERYGVSKASVTMNASQHPVFLLEDGVVTVRPEDHPYVPEADLVDTRSCFVVGGAWTYRMPVDSDVLRGSGRAIPEAFAVHLGLEPMKSGELAGPVRGISVAWRQYPAIGSIRVDVEALGLVEGDAVFIRRATASSLDFIGLRRSDLDGATPAERIRLLVGADPHDLRDTHFVVAEALGMGLAAAPSREAVEARLRSRGDIDIVEAMQMLS